MKICEHCKAQNNDESSFCVACGQTLLTVKSMDTTVAPSYTAPQPAAITGEKKGQSIASLIFGILSLLSVLIAPIAIIEGIIAIILGILGRKKGGKGLAIGGIVTGVLGLIGGIIWGALMLIGVMATKSVVDEIKTNYESDPELQSEVKDGLNLLNAEMCAIVAADDGNTDNCTPSAKKALAEACTQPSFVEEHSAACIAAGAASDNQSNLNDANFVVGKWDCGNDYGIKINDDGTYGGNDYENMTLSRRYEFDSNGGIYLYPISPEDPAATNVAENYMRGRYTIKSTQNKENGAVEYLLDVTISEYMADGELETGTVGKTSELSVMNNPQDADNIVIYDYNTNPKMCFRVK